MHLPDFEAACIINTIRADACRLACENFAGIHNRSEAETIKYFSQYDLVFAVWIERDITRPLDESQIFGRLIKGTCAPEVGQTLNAFPVENLEEALRWSALLSQSEGDQTAGLRLATNHGERLLL